MNSNKTNALKEIKGNFLKNAAFGKAEQSSTSVLYQKGRAFKILSNLQ